MINNQNLRPEDRQLIAMHRLSANTLIAQVIRDLDIENANRRTDAMMEWCFEAEQLIDTERSYIRKECVLRVENYRAELPGDFYDLVSVKVGDSYMEHTGRDFVLFHKGTSSNIEEDVTDQGGNGNLADRRAQDSLSNLNHPVINNLAKFYIADGFINTTTTNTDIGLAYHGFPIEEVNGIMVPMIHPNHATAVTAYLVYKYLFPGFVKGKVSGSVYAESKNRWLELCLNARGTDSMPDRKRADYIAAIWNNLKVHPPKQVF